jgi:hypothetical protein
MHTTAGKSHLGALINGVDGAMRAPTEEENIYYTRLDTGIREGCQILKPTDRVRYLGWFTAMSDEVGESQKQAAEEISDRLRKIATKNARVPNSRSLSKLLSSPEFYID